MRAEEEFYRLVELYLELACPPARSPGFYPGAYQAPFSEGPSPFFWLCKKMEKGWDEDLERRAAKILILSVSFSKIAKCRDFGEGDAFSSHSPPVARDSIPGLFVEWRAGLILAGRARQHSCRSLAPTAPSPSFWLCKKMEKGWDEDLNAVRRIDPLGIALFYARGLLFKLVYRHTIFYKTLKRLPIWGRMFHGGVCYYKE